jgi:hypothetical protein
LKAEKLLQEQQEEQKDQEKNKKHKKGRRKQLYTEVEPYRHTMVRCNSDIVSCLHDLVGG